MATIAELLRRFQEEPTVPERRKAPAAAPNLAIRVYDHVAGFAGICPVTPELACGADRDVTIDRYCAKGIDRCFAAHLYDPDEFTYFALGSYLQNNGIDPTTLPRLRGSFAVFWTQPWDPQVAVIHRIAEAGHAVDSSLYRRLGSGMFYFRGDPQFAVRLNRKSLPLRSVGDGLESFRSLPFDWLSDHQVAELVSRALHTHRTLAQKGDATAQSMLQPLERSASLLRAPRAEWTAVGPPARPRGRNGPDTRQQPRGPEVVVRGVLPPSGDSESRSTDVATAPAGHRVIGVPAEGSSTASPVTAPPPASTGAATKDASTTASASLPARPQTAAQPTEAPVDAPPVPSAVGPEERSRPDTAAAADGRAGVSQPLFQRLDRPGMEAVLARSWRVRGRLVGDKPDLKALLGLVRDFRTMRFHPVGWALHAEHAVQTPSEAALTKAYTAARETLTLRATKGERRSIRFADQLRSRLEAESALAHRSGAEHLRRILDATMSAPTLSGAARRKAAGLPAGDGGRRAEAQAWLLGAELLSVHFDGADRWAARGDFPSDEMFVGLDALTSRIHGGSQAETAFVRAALGLIAEEGTQLLILAPAFGGVVASLIAVGATWTKLEPFKKRDPWGQSIPPVESWRDEADSLQAAASGSGESTTWGEGSRRVDALGTLAGEFLAVIRHNSLRNFHRKVVEHLGESDTRLGSLIARNVNEVLPVLEVEVWEMGALREVQPVFQARLVTRDGRLNWTDSGGAVPRAPASVHAEVRRVLMDDPTSEAPFVSRRAWASWLADRGLGIDQGIKAIVTASKFEDVCTISVPLRVGDAVVELIRVSLFASASDPTAAGVVERVLGDLSFPLSLAEKHAKGVSSGRKGAQQDIAAMVSHSIKNMLQPAQSDILCLREALEGHGVAGDEEVGPRLHSLGELIKLVASRVNMLYLLSQERISAADIDGVAASSWLAELETIFKRAWSNFASDINYTGKREEYVVDGAMARPDLDVAFHGPADAVLHLHRVTVDYAFEEVFLNCFRHSQVEPGVRLVIRTQLALLDDEGIVEAFVVNPGTVGSGVSKGGSASGGRRFGRESLRVILEDLLHGGFELRAEASSVRAILRFPMDQRPLAGGTS